MEPCFSTVLLGLRQSRNLNQRQLAADLHISQALLSNYENGSREPGLPFVCRACDYFGVSADFLLGRCEDESGAALSAELSGFFTALRETSDGELKAGAQAYINAAARRVTSRLDSNGDELLLAETAATMANEELFIVRATKGDV
ncbi:MAG: helix-turn-helix transcriptional regulator [Oscillospiraceae bacterium]